jgi:hypothetical protein
MPSRTANKIPYFMVVILVFFGALCCEYPLGTHNKVDTDKVKYFVLNSISLAHNGGDHGDKWRKCRDNRLAIR